MGIDIGAGGQFDDAVEAGFAPLANLSKSKAIARATCNGQSCAILGRRQVL